jgi:hypothetical protein
MIRANNIKLKHKKMGGILLPPSPPKLLILCIPPGVQAGCFNKSLLTRKVRVVYRWESIVAVSHLPQTQNNFVKYYEVKFTCKI